jgi:hypothetical protein
LHGIAVIAGMEVAEIVPIELVKLGGFASGEK